MLCMAVRNGAVWSRPMKAFSSGRLDAASGIVSVELLCELCSGICITTEETARKSLRVVEKCQSGTVHCVHMATLRVARQVVDPYCPALGDPGRRSVSVNVCQAAQLRGSLYHLTSSRITQI